MKKVAQTYSLIRIVKVRPNVWSLKRKFGKKSLKRALPLDRRKLSCSFFY